ncbi:MAG: protein kinase domain-containing protein [Snowella sp.]
MTLLYCSKTDKKIVLHQQIASSGEGHIWTTEDSQILAKIYHASTPQRQEKLKVMFQHPPEDPNQGKNHISFAWPQSLLISKDGVIRGFLMPKIEEGRELIDVYNPRRRNKVGLKIDWHFLHVVSHNIASIIHSIHEAGYVLGDIKPQNILVNSQAVPSIIDTDSFQVTNPKNGHIYRCLVGSEGFTPPELLNQDFSQVNQTEVHDRFRLGVVIYYLLFGSHPFQGKWIGPGDSPELTELIRKGSWAFDTKGFIRPSPLTIPLSVLHPSLKDGFIRCFTEGYQNPRQRPTAEEWQQSLQVALQELKQCDRESRHFHYVGNPSCYWCKRQEALNFDIFGDKTPVKVAANPMRKDKKEMFSQSASPSSVGVAPYPRRNLTNRRYPHLKRYPPQSPSMMPPPYLLNRNMGYQVFINFNRYASPLLKSLPWLAGVLILIFLVQEFPQFKSRENFQANVGNLPIFNNPDDAIAYNERGYRRYKRGEYFGALTDFNKAIQINPNLADAYLNRRLVNEVLGNEKLSERDLLKAITIEPDNPRVSSFYRANQDLLKDINTNTKSTLETELFKLPENKDNQISKTIKKKILLKNQSKAANAQKELFANLPNTQKSPSRKSYLDPLQTLEDYHNSLANKTSLETPDIFNTDKSSNNNQSYSDELMTKNSRKSLALNSRLASSFLQRGTYYKNLGIYSEAIKNFEQAYLLLEKEGHLSDAKAVEAMINELKKSQIPN